MFEECGRKALTDQKEKQMSDIRSKDMDQHNRYARRLIWTQSLIIWNR